MFEVKLGLKSHLFQSTSLLQTPGWDETIQNEMEGNSMDGTGGMRMKRDGIVSYDGTG